MDKALTNHVTREANGEDWITGTLLFRHWDAMKREILLHKWYESEKAGHDVGWERAATNWMIHYSQKFQYRKPIDSAKQA